MRKSVESFIALNRGTLLLLAVVLSFGVFGVFAWHSRAQKQDGDADELSRLEAAASEMKETLGTGMSGDDLVKYESIWARINELQNSRFSLIAAPTTNTTVPGTLTLADPTFNRPANCGLLSATGTAVHYDAIPVTLACPTSVTISTEVADGGSITPNGASGIGPDSYMVLYGPGGFNPASPLTNCLLDSDDININTNRRARIISGTLAAGSYTAVLTSFANTPVTFNEDAALPWTYTVAINDACGAPPTRTVDTVSDAGGLSACTAAPDDCSLRGAIAGATAGDTIDFASPLFDSPQVITLSEAAGFQQLVIDKNLTVTGKGAHLTTVRRSP